MLEPCVENSIMSLVEYLDSEMAWFTSKQIHITHEIQNPIHKGGKENWFVNKRIGKPLGRSLIHLIEKFFRTPSKDVAMTHLSSM